MSRRQVFGAALLLLSTAAPGYAAAYKTPKRKTDVHTSQKTTTVTPTDVTTEDVSKYIHTELKDEPDSEKATKRAQQTQARQLQEASMKAQQAQSRQAEEMLKLHQEQARQTQEVARLDEITARDKEEADRVKQESLRRAHQREMQELAKAADVAKVKEEKARDEGPKVDTKEEAFNKAHVELTRTSFGESRKITDRDALPELTVKAAPFGKAVSQPFVIRTANGDQRHLAQTYQQSWQTRQFPIPLAQAPGGRAELKARQITAYLNNYPAYVNHQEVTITRKNTFIREVPPTQYPVWYERNPGWTYCNGYVLGGSIESSPEWFDWEWPAIYGKPPAGFLCQPDFIPTPFVYLPYCDKWRQTGEMAYRPGPDANYTGPITVEAIEPVTAKIPDQFGVPVFQTINVVYLYDAFYYPEFERWGYENKQGFFVWLNI